MYTELLRLDRRPLQSSTAQNPAMKMNKVLPRKRARTVIVLWLTKRAGFISGHEFG